MRSWTIRKLSRTTGGPPEVPKLYSKPRAPFSHQQQLRGGGGGSALLDTALQASVRTPKPQALIPFTPPLMLPVYTTSFIPPFVPPPFIPTLIPPLYHPYAPKPRPLRPGNRETGQGLRQHPGRQGPRRSLQRCAGVGPACLGAHPASLCHITPSSCCYAVAYVCVARL